MNIWKSKKLKEFDAIEIILGQSPSSKSYNKKSDGLPFLQGKAEFGIIYPKPKIFTDAPLKIAESNDLLLSVRAPVGDINLSPYKLCIGRGLAAIRFKKDNPKFYFYWFLKNQKAIESLGVGSTFKAITGEQLKKIEIPVVELSEQTAIANILSTVDEAIQKADEAITKTERIKQAMMKKLFTEGIGHKEFKQTKIGKTPNDWVIRKIGEVINKSGKIDPTKSDNEFKYVDISSINNQTFKIISTNKVDKNNAPSRARKLIKKGNIIYATTRPYLQNIAIVPQSLDNQICSTGFCVMEADEKIVSNKWLFYNVITSRFNKRIESKMKGATYPAVNDSDLYEELISIPSVKEQNKITDIFDDFSRKLDLEISRKQSLEKIKQGLMDDLLTSKKRIKIN